MDHKSTGIEYDRELFAPAAQQPKGTGPSIMGMLLVVLAVVAVGGLGFLGYRMMNQGGGSVTPGDSRSIVQMQQRISEMSDRLDKLEQENHRLASAQALANSKKPEPVQTAPGPAATAPTTVIYRVSPTLPRSGAATDPATAQKLSAMQKDLGAAQTDVTANREAWQATTDRLADVAGQVGSQHGEILKGQDELNQLLSQTERSALPFELHRGSSPQQLGPVTVALKSTNPRNQRYTVCVYVQRSCVELKDRTLYEVVQVALNRDSPALQVIATKVSKDVITGYLEVPRGVTQ